MRLAGRSGLLRERQHDEGGPHGAGSDEDSHGTPPRPRDGDQRRPEAGARGAAGVATWMLGGVISLPYAGANRIRFEGVISGRCGHP
jgi:hypothetical protein